MESRTRELLPRASKKKSLIPVPQILVDQRKKVAVKTISSKTQRPGRSRPQNVPASPHINRKTIKQLKKTTVATSSPPPPPPKTVSIAKKLNFENLKHQDMSALKPTVISAEEIFDHAAKESLDKMHVSEELAEVKDKIESLYPAPSENVAARDTANHGHVQYSGPGGRATTKHGLQFEKNTSAAKFLQENGYKKYERLYRLESSDKKPRYTKCTYLKKHYPGKTIYYFDKLNFNIYSKKKFKVTCYRIPDEIYYIKYFFERKPTLKVLEKKFQSVTGSVDQKLGLGNFFKFEYNEIYSNKFDIEYAFCVSDFLKRNVTSNKKKFNILKKYMNINNNALMFGEDDNYLDTLLTWIEK